MSQYTTGKVFVTASSNVIFGSASADWTSISAGNWFTLLGSNVTFNIASTTLRVAAYFTAFAAGTTYATNTRVSYGGKIYASLSDSNLAHQPDISPIYWAECSGWEATLTVNWSGVTAANKSYGIVRDFTTLFGLPLPAPGDIETPAILSRAFQTLEDNFSSGGLTANTRHSLAVVFDASTGDEYGLEMVSAVQTGSSPALRMFTSSLASSYLAFGKYTGDTAFTEFAKFSNAGNLTLNYDLGVTGSTTLSGALTYGGVTLSGSVTGTGSMVLSSSPTIVTPVVSGALTYGGVTLSNSVTGTGSMVLSTTPTITTPVISGALTYGGVALSSSVTGTGSMVLSNTPTLTTPVLNGLPTGTGVASAASVSTLMSRDSNGVANVVNLNEGYATTVTAAGTTVLTVASAYQQYFTGSTTQTVTLPVTSTLALGQSWCITNLSTGSVTINSSGANAVVILAGGTSAIITCILTSGTTAASWNSTYFSVTEVSGKKLTLNNTLTFSGTDSTTMTFPASSTTVAGLGITQTFTGVNTFTPAARSSGTAAFFTVTTPADTGITAATESIGINFVAGTRTWADGTVAVQRHFLVAAPTLNRATTAATFTKAATFAVSAAPIAGTGVTITNPYALWVQAGLSQFDGRLVVSDATASTSTTTGSATFAGGVGVVGTVSADSLAWTTLLSTGSGTLRISNGRQFNISGSSTALTVNDGSAGNNPLVITGGATSAGIVTVAYTTASTSTSTGALVVSGGIGAAGRVTAGSFSAPGSGTNTERFGAGATTSTSPGGATAVGANATASGDSDTAVGTSATASGSRGIALGNSASASTNNYAIAIGWSAGSTGGVRIGGSGTAATDGIAIGGYNVTAATGEIRLHTSNRDAEVYLGAGSAAAAGYYTRINGAGHGSAGGTGGILYLAGGKGGDAASTGGAVTIQTANAGAGTTLVNSWSVAAGGRIAHTPSNFSLSSWTTSGALSAYSAATVTDSSTAASGTAASAVFHSFAVPTLAATNASVTTTAAATVYIAGGPTAGTNQTITTSYGLWVAGKAKVDDYLYVASDQNSIYAGGWPRTNFTTNGSSVWSSGSTTGAATLQHDFQNRSGTSLLALYGTGNATLAGALTVSSSTASTSTTTGALIVSGGTGIAGAIYGGSTLSVASTTDVSASAASATISGGVYIAKSLSVMGSQSQDVHTHALNVLSSSTLNAAFVSNATPSSTSGAGLSGYVYAIPTGADQRLGFLTFGTRNSSTGQYNSVAVLGFSSGAWTAGASHPSYMTFEVAGASATRTEVVRMSPTVVTVNPATASSSTATGALVVSGGVGVAGNLFVGAVVTAVRYGAGSAASSTAGYFSSFDSGGANNVGFIESRTLSSANTGSNYSFDSNLGTAAAVFTAASVGGLLVRDSGKGAGSTVTTQYGVNVTALTMGSTIYGIRSQITSGASNYNLYLDGTAQNLLAGATSITSNTASSSTSTGALIITGGVGVGGKLYVGSDLNFGTTILGPSASSATSTAISLTSTLAADSDQFYLGDGARGIRIRTYQDGSNNARIMFAYSNPNGATYLEAFRIQGSGAGAASHVVSVPGTKASTSTTTGAFTVAGGAGIAGDLFIGGNTTFGTSASVLNGTTGSIGLTAVGTNQNVTITPTGTGALIVPSTATGGFQVWNNTDTTNYERAEIYWNSNVLRMGTGSAGTGTKRAVQIGVDTGSRTYLQINTNNTLPYFTFTQAAGTSNAGDWVLITTQGTGITNTSGTTNWLAIKPIYNQSASTAINTDLLINRTETLIGSGAQRFIDAQVAGTSKFIVTNAGKLLLNGLTTDGTGVVQFAVHTTTAGGISFGATQQIWTSTTGVLDFGISGTSYFNVNGNTASMLLKPGGTQVAFLDSSGVNFTWNKGVTIGDTALAKIVMSANTTAGVMQFTAPNGTGSMTFATGAATVALTLSSAQQVQVNASTASTSSTTGALIVSGGVGVAGAGYFGGNVVPNVTATSDLGTASLVWKTLYARDIVGSGGTQLGSTVKTGNYTLTAQDTIVVCNSGSALTITMVAASSHTNRVYMLKNIGAGAVTVDATSLGQIFINSLFNTIILYTGDSATLVSDGTRWNLI